LHVLPHMRTLDLGQMQPQIGSQDLDH
jgi:hypothetical protein